MNSSARDHGSTTAMRFYLSVFTAMIFAVGSSAATDNKPAPAGIESIGGRLLDGLSPDAGTPTAPPQPAQKVKGTKEVEDSLKAGTPLHGLAAGANPASQSLARVQNSMQQAQSLLTQPGAGGTKGTAQLASPVQHEILSDLDKLIAELSKQCQSCNGQSQGGNQPPKPGQNSKPGKSGKASSSGRTAARDSTDRLDSSSAKPVEKGEVNEMAKALWGHLPERSRQQMLQSFSDEFLPKYEIEIEQYYRRLSEEQAESGK